MKKSTRETAEERFWRELSRKLLEAYLNEEPEWKKFYPKNLSHPTKRLKEMAREGRGRLEAKGFEEEDLHAAVEKRRHSASGKDVTTSPRQGAGKTLWDRP